MTTNEIYLSETDQVGQGGGRIVYQHPECPKLLIKIVRKELLDVQPDWSLNRKLGRTLRPNFRRHGPFQEWYAEYEEYITLVNRLRRLPDFIANYHGFAQTNLGPGLVVEKITTKTGILSPTLDSYVSVNGFDSRIDDLIEELVQKILLGRVVLKDFKPGNVVIGYDHASNKDRLVIVDGVSEGTLIKVQRWSDLAFRRSWKQNTTNFRNLVCKRCSNHRV
jgi:hypothetical protein